MGATAFLAATNTIQALEKQGMHRSLIAAEAHGALTRASAARPGSLIAPGLLQVQRLTADLLQAAPPLQVAADALRDQLRSSGMACCAYPPVRTCLKCDKELGLMPAKYGDAPIFYDLFQQGRQGKVFRSCCMDCRIVYDIDGYMSLKDFDAAPAERHLRLKLPYAAGSKHPDWIRVSSQTVISTKFQTLGDALLQFSQGGFSALTRINSAMILHDTGNPSATPQDLEPRALLYEKRLAEGLLKQSAVDVAATSPALLGNFNLLMPLDAMLQAVEQLFFHNLNDELHQHLATSTAQPLCGRGISLDGHMKVCRSRCHCLKPAHDDLENGDLQSGEGMFFYKHCQNTPARGDKLRRCKECAAADNRLGLEPEPEAQEPEPDGPAGDGAGAEEGSIEGEEATAVLPCDPQSLNSATLSLHKEKGLPHPVPTAPRRSLRIQKQQQALAQTSEQDQQQQQTQQQLGAPPPPPPTTQQQEQQLSALQQPPGGPPRAGASGRGKKRAAEGVSEGADEDAAAPGPPPVLQEDGEEWYAVEAVLGCRRDKTTRRLLYEVKFKGYPGTYWEPSSHVSADLIAEYRQYCRKTRAAFDGEEAAAVLSGLAEEPLAEELAALDLCVPKQPDKNTTGGVYAAMADAAATAAKVSARSLCSLCSRLCSPCCRRR